MVEQRAKFVSDHMGESNENGSRLKVGSMAWAQRDRAEGVGGGMHCVGTFEK